jgi:CheY-like chemotaxis protein
MLGLNVVTARDGIEALSMIRRHKPGLLLLDMRMPIMSGRDVLLTLGADPTTSDLPVMVITGSDLDESYWKSLHHNVCGVVQKDALEISTLQAQVQAILPT